MNRLGHILPALLATLAGGCASVPGTGRVLAHWVQLGPDGQRSLRAIVPAAARCPVAETDAGPLGMALRVAAGGGTSASENPAFDPRFDVNACEYTVPASARTMTIDGRPQALGSTSPQRIVIVGDTGCRIKVPKTGKGDPIQDCADPQAWPWPRIAAAAARLQPDLVIHVGDYHYREACDDPKRCADAPITGYSWNAWKADFFDPAEPLLKAAPWIMVRGNHENCDRGGAGWMRFLAPGPYAACGNQRLKTDTRSSPGNNLTADAYVLNVDADLAIAVVDNAAHEDFRAATQTPADSALFARTLEPLRTANAARNLWFISHKPIWYELIDDRHQPNAFQAALRERLPANTRLAIAGHQHSFTTHNYKDGQRPPQLIVGNSGTQLEAFDPESPLYEGGAGVGSRERAKPDGDRRFDGQPAASGINLNRYGFLLMERNGTDWSGQVMDPDGQPVNRCGLDIRARTFDCTFPDRR